MGGFSKREIDDAQTRNGLTFPPDLIELLQHQRSLICHDGRRFDFTCMSADIRLLQGVKIHPYRTLRFDVERNALWWPSWGECPSTLSGKRRRLRQVLRQAPPLISLQGHRYLPALPCEAGNPVISMMGIDTIYYGTDIWSWMPMDNFIAVKSPRRTTPKYIDFWSELVLRYRRFNMNRPLSDVEAG